MNLKKGDLLLMLYHPTGAIAQFIKYDSSDDNFLIIKTLDDQYFCNLFTSTVLITEILNRRI